MSDQRSEIPGSAPIEKYGERWSSPLDPNQKVSATILMRRQGGASSKVAEQLLGGSYHPASREAAAASLASSPQDLQALRDFVTQQGLTISEEDADSRRVRIEGTAGQMQQAFGVQMGWVENANGQRHISYKGNLSVPQSLAPIVTAVLGLDQRPIARHASAGQSDHL